MRKYQGKYPNNICMVSSTKVQGRVLVKTNNGNYFYIDAKDTAGIMPEVATDIFKYPFIRAQPMTFQQDVTRFHRMLDGYALPFVEYVERRSPEQLEMLEKNARELFIADMTRQGILPRFT